MENKMSQSAQFKCPCARCLPIMLIVLGIVLLGRELKAHHACLHTACQPAE